MADLPRPVLPRRIPKKVAQAPHRWHKGLFVAANVRMAASGEPLFGQVNSEWVTWAMINRVCQLCGQHISKSIPLILPGGPNDIEYTEAPLHVECARYSMLVCPRILSRRSTFTFFVCKDYHLMSYNLGDLQKDKNAELADYVDYIQPKPLRRNSNLALNMYFAHDWDRGSMHNTCGCIHLQRLKYDEFLRWSAPE